MIAQIKFGLVSEDNYNTDSIDEITFFIGCLRREGHVFGEEVLGVIEGEIICSVYCYEEFEMIKACESEHSKNELKKIVETFQQEPRICFGNRRKEISFAQKTFKTLLLYTHFLDNSTPIVNPHTGIAIPMYKLKIDYKTKEGLLHWQDKYKAIDRLFMLGTGKNEIKNYKEIADPFSEFNQETAKMAADLEEETGIPTYYYLHRYYSFGPSEANLPCPICKKPWTKSSKFRVKLKFIDWICHNCRVMSCLGVSEEGKRKASIGIHK